MFTPLKLFLQSQRKHKRYLTVAYDVIALFGSLYCALAIRLGEWPLTLGTPEIISAVVTVMLSIFLFTKLGLYRAVLRYMMIPALGHIFAAISLSAIVLSLSGFFLQSFVPRSVPLIYAALAYLTLGGPRIVFRTIYYHYNKRRKPNVLIYGAGSTGRQLAYSLINGHEYHPVVIIDDDYQKVGQIISGLRVHHSKDMQKLLSLYEPVKLLLAINNISKTKRQDLIERCAEFPIAIQSVPSVEDIASGQARLDEVKDLTISDLLGRTQVEPNHELLSRNITGKSVMVTGAGGSIGSELCRQIIRQNPTTLVLFELNEYNLYAIEREMQSMKSSLKLDVNIVASLGSVQRKNRVKHLMTTHQVETVYHSAAYKHVPLVEDNVIEGVRNNIFGTLYVAEAAIEAGVKNFTLISTDKAVRPTNIMGTSKRMAELLLQAQADKQSSTTFTIVRFGNVLGSSGSVVPLFKQQIKQGGPVTVTHPDITRYFMLIPEAAQLVIQAGAMAHNGQVFLLDMGKPVKILDLAERMIKLMGYSVKNGQSSDKYGDEIEIQFTGLRPGEKLYEELLIGDNVEGTFHPAIYSAKEEKLSWEEMNRLLDELDESCHLFQIEKVVKLLVDAPTGYTGKHPLAILDEQKQ
ncbi:polysaccharide biosynthesis protein [Photobacterium sp. BZF1]|uniref:nucleoside-diphosphate sugar epimerase/dehydratase n=1 Tax=Photobacterium sp. BZF1 TaxID=1904457 RepID=UPI0016538DB6|nr:nucleoside-diphosphate sugar epimerase/dehydratase [Photobacterium sp. BZF1]MBC7005807.1 polysaccharide biosynthesis protein [Photobacterium sp. BZF1]